MPAESATVEHYVNWDVDMFDQDFERKHRGNDVTETNVISDT